MERKRRKNGEGTVYQRQSDQRWAVEIDYLDPKTGVFRRKTIYGTSEVEVGEKLRGFRDALRHGLTIDPAKLTLEEWLDKWMETWVIPKVRQKTREGYDSIIRSHIVPVIGMIKLRELTSTDVQTLLNNCTRQSKKPGVRDQPQSGEPKGSSRPLPKGSKRCGRFLSKEPEISSNPLPDKPKKPLSRSTKKAILVVITIALKKAVALKLISENVAKEAEVETGGDEKEPRVLDSNELNSLLAVAETDRLGPLIILMVSTGLRVGEALALQWSNVNFETRTLRVTHALQRLRVPTATTTTSLVIASPKTKSSKRTVALHEGVVEQLMSWKAQQDDERRLMGPEYVDTDLVFTTIFGTPLDPGNVSRALKRMSEAAGIPRVNPHALRHTFASHLIASDASAKTVQAFLGHTTVKMTLDKYTHLVSDEMRQATDHFGQMLKQRAQKTLSTNVARD